MKVLKLLTLLLLPGFLLAQKPIYQKVQQAQARNQATTFNLVNPVATNLRDAGVPSDELSEGMILQLNQAQINTLLDQSPELIQLTFPLADQSEVTVDLVPNQVLAHDFILRVSSNAKDPTPYEGGLHYHGVIDGDEQSIVAISIFEDEIIGLINTPRENYVIGKMKNTTDNRHIIYNDYDLQTGFDLDCGTIDDGVGYTTEQLRMPDEGSRDPGDCIRVYIEIDDDIVSNKGGATGATNFVTGLFNEVITLYANDDMTMVISEIKAWDTPAPYSGSSSSAMLSSYQSNTGAFNGDLSHLVSYQASGGIAAGFSGICNSNVDNSKCFSSIDGSYSAVPTYSWSVMVTTHEMGHLIGSRHTHACVWNGNNTAIDGCAGATEGSCSLPGYPSGGGTIMSYCHLQSVGINLNNGFGPQPKAVVNNTVNAAGNCLTGCGSGGPTCFDGIQNGNETGVDCGGPDCNPCPQPCTENEVTVSINLDNYPEETSWEIRNSGGSVVASGGTYGGQPDGSNVTIDECLADGCYDFIIYDTYGDGICCGYGNGSYTVTNGGTTLASGGSFGSSETTNFCLGGGGPILGCTDPNAHNYDPNATQDDGSCEDCSDGIQNGDETGVDCGGTLCAPCNTGCSPSSSTYTFESGWEGWIDGGSDCYRYSGGRSYEGSYSIRIRDNSGSASAMTSPSYDLSEYSSVDVEFYFYPNSMETGEDFWLRVNNGSGWTTVATWASGSSFNNNTFYTTTVNVPASSLSANTQFRFQCDASANADRVYIDLVTISGICGGALIESDEPVVTTTEVETPAHFLGLDEISIDEEGYTDVKVYPNPATETINLNANQEIQFVRVVSLSGQIMKTVQTQNLNEEIDISQYQPGTYLLLIQLDGELVTKKFVKM